MDRREFGCRAYLGLVRFGGTIANAEVFAKRALDWYDKTFEIPDKAKQTEELLCNCHERQMWICKYCKLDNQTCGEIPRGRVCDGYEWNGTREGE